MAIIMGGSGSSGSTMLIRKLSTHPEIFCGGEINFFNKEQLFDNWSKNKLKILPLLPFFSTKGWQIYRRSTLYREEYGWTKEAVKKLLQESSSIQDFTASYFEKPMQEKNAKLWIEKTPSNAYSFTKFLEQYPEGKVVHIARNPLDSAASMYNKDPRVYYAVGTWLYNNAAALAASSSDRYHLVKYEDLIYDQENTLQKLCDFIGVDPKEIILEKEDKEKHIASWDNSPDAKISDSSMGRFKKLPQAIQDEIHTAFHYFKVSEIHKKTKGIQFDTFDEICVQLGYHSALKPLHSLKGKLQKEVQKDKLLRNVKRYETKGRYYPIDFK